MLNINQNFDLKAPVFNFDRDYFNSVEELNAYDTSNVPNHFVTNVAGMLYQFTDGKWLPMIGTTSDDEENAYYINLGSNCSIDVYPNTNYCQFSIGPSEDYSSISGGNIFMYSDVEGDTPNIGMRNGTNGAIKDMYIGKTGGEFGLNIRNEKNGNVDSIKMLIDRELTSEEQEEGYSTSGILLTNRFYDHGSYYTCTTNIDANGFINKTREGQMSVLNGYGLSMLYNYSSMSYLSDSSLAFIKYDDDEVRIFIGTDDSEDYYMAIGSDNKFKISRPADNTEGATITGVKSLTAFSNPSATKVWATDGSTVDLTTKANASDLDAKANASDILLKKSASGGYYIEENNNTLGSKAFAANNLCTASGNFSFAEGYGKATQYISHAEGEYATASGYASHAEGSYTVASGFCAHAQGAYSITNKNAIHSVGIGNSTTRKNAEYIYSKTKENGYGLTDDPKNGYKYLIGVGGYDGISTDNTTYKSVQEVIADLTARIEQLETLVANCVSISNVDEQTN